MACPARAEPRAWHASDATADGRLRSHDNRLRHRGAHAARARWRIPRVNDIADLHIEREQDTYIAILRGEIDPSNARDLGRQLTNAVPNDAMAVVVDLTDVHYIDSA